MNYYLVFLMEQQLTTLFLAKKVAIFLLIHFKTYENLIY